ncbi:MAG: class II aldolase/adducin family protein [Bacteroidales bacterium]
MDQLNALVEISRAYGSNPDFVIAGGGNTSYKDDRELYVKASGISLATISKEGFVKLSREKLKEMEQSTFPTDPMERENAVKNALAEAVVAPRNLRPSVETSLHNLIGYPFIVHTHPTLVNALMCSNNAKEEVEKRFGGEALYVEYTDPGYILFRKLQGMIMEYQTVHHRPPSIIFLQNHGVFVGGNDVEAINSTYRTIETKIREGVDLSLPAGEMEERSSRIASGVNGYMKGRNRVVRAYRSPLSDHFSADRASFLKISRPFSPDIIVYCKSNYLFLEGGWDLQQVIGQIEQFESTFGYLPRVMIEEQGGLIISEEDEKSMRTVLEVFQDMMKISWLSGQFGGPHFMTEEQIAFIDSWEVENYRRSVARKAGG